jgi:hypothetical protein
MEVDFTLFSTAINATLYKYNYLDNQIWTRLKNTVDYIEIERWSILVSSDQLIEFLEINYRPIVNRIKAVGAEFLHKEVNTPWFLYAVLNEMQDLQYIKFNLNCDKKYTRLVEIDGDKMIKFDFKVLSMTINFYDFFTKSELDRLNKSLVRLNLFEEGVPYLRMLLVDFLNKIDEFVSKSYDADESVKKEADLLASFMDLVDPKLERDNPLVLFVTDY